MGNAAADLIRFDAPQTGRMDSGPNAYAVFRICNLPAALTPVEKQLAVSKPGSCPLETCDGRDVCGSQFSPIKSSAALVIWPMRE